MKSLYSRVCLVALGVILLSCILGFLGSNMYYHAKLKPFNDAKLIGIAQQLQSYAEREGTDVDSYLHNAATLGYQIFLTDNRGDDRYYGREFRERQLDSSVKEQVLEGTPYHGVADYPNQAFISGFFENALSNSVGVPLRFQERNYALFLRPDVILQFGELRIFFGLMGVFAVAISILLFLVSTRYVVKPITRLSAATRRIAQGHYQMELPVSRRDEIGELSRNFRLMGKELERVDEGRRQFVANVSHEFQSPLTLIQGFAKILAEQELSPDERAHYAGIIGDESRRLSVLGKQLLLLSTLEQGRETLQRNLFSLKTQIRQAVQVFQWQIEEKALLVKLSVPEEIRLHGDEVLFMQVWTNLIGNAVKYIPAGRTVDIRAEQMAGGGCRVLIRDNGDGIAPEHLPFLFDRFYKADAARERDSGGTGLGLSIAAKIVRLHHGTIEVSSSAEGTLFTVTLPNL